MLFMEHNPQACRSSGPTLSNSRIPSPSFVDGRKRGKSMEFVESEDLGLSSDSSSFNSYVAFDLGQRAIPGKSLKPDGLFKRDSAMSLVTHLYGTEGIKHSPDPQGTHRVAGRCTWRHDCTTVGSVMDVSTGGLKVVP